MESVVRKGYKAILSAPWYLNYISYGRDWTKYYEQDPHTFLMYASGKCYDDEVHVYWGGRIYYDRRLSSWCGGGAEAVSKTCLSQIHQNLWVA